MHLRLVLVVPLLGAPACNHDVNNGDGSTSTFGDGNPATMTLTTMTAGGSDSGGSTGSGSDGTVDESETTSAPLPECPGRCVEMAPEGWNGPVATMDSDPLEDPPACPTGFENVATEGFEDLVAADAICGCECGTPSGVLCEQTAVLVDYGASANCNGPIVDTYNLTNAVCSTTGIASSSWVALQQVELLNTGSCEAVPSELLPEIGWENRVTACEGEVMAGFACDATPNLGCLEVAPAAPLGQRMCIWQEGDVECPEDSVYADDRILHTSVEDTRACSECTCDDPVGICNNSQATMYAATSCTFPVSGFSMGTGFCAQIGSTATRARYIAGAPTSFCPPVDVEPMGDVDEAMPITLCCTN